MKLTKTEEMVRGFYEQKGIGLFKPSWPDFAGFVKQTGEPLFVEVKGMGDRLSSNQYDSFRILASMGFKIEVAIMNIKGEVQIVSFDKDKERLRMIPTKIKPKLPLPIKEIPQKKQVEIQTHPLKEELVKKHEKMMEELNKGRKMGIKIDE
jgi:hypothetical protein